MKLKSLLIANWNALLAFSIVLLSGTVLWNEYKKITHEPITSWKQDPVADCGVVLTGGSGRVSEGFALLSRKNIQKLIISGTNPTSDLRELLPQWIFYGDLQEKNIVLEKRSQTTYGNAKQSLTIVGAFNCRDIVLITSQWHMYRAYKTFRAAYPAHISIYKHSVPTGRLEGNALVLENLEEVFKSVFYSLWAYPSLGSGD